MPIKFRCPDCRAKIKVSEQFAGQLGACPTCRKRTRIPAASDPEFAGEPGGKPSTVEQPADAGRKASSVQLAGGDVESPSSPTGTEVEVKDKAPEATPPEPDVPAPQPEAPATEGHTEEAKSAPAFIRFKCPNCEKPTGFPTNLAGKPVTCPLCKMQIMVPEESGGDSFVVGALPPGAKASRTATARSPGSRVTSGIVAANATPAPVAATPASARTPWVWIGAGGAALLILAVLIGILIGGMGKGQHPEQQASATAPAVRPPELPPDQPSVEQSAQRNLPPVTPVVQVPATPYLPPANVTPDDRAATPATQPAEEKAEEKKAETPVTPTDPTALIPDSLPRPKAKDEDEDAPPAKKTEGAGTTATDTVTGILDEGPKTVAPTTPTAPTEPNTITPVPKPPPCQKCLGCGHIPIPNLRPYVYVYSERPPDPAAVVPWIYCDQCMKDHDNKQLPALEAERFARTVEKNKVWDDIFAGFKSKLVHVETRHVLLHCELPVTVAVQVATVLDKLTASLQARSRSALLTQTRPDTHEIVVVATLASYNDLITALEKKAPGDDWGMLRKSTGFSFSKLSVFNAANSGSIGPSSMAIHQFSKMLISTACDGHAPPWLTSGFSSYCENFLTQRNLCYTFAYEMNDVKFGENWNQDIRKFATKGELKKWDYIFPIDLIGLKALDYLTCYSMVSFFMGDGQRFAKLTAEIRDGTQSAPALEKVYGRPVKELQTMWVNWAVQQR